jgi:putative alpha-1,2-mannosidase
LIEKKSIAVTAAIAAVFGLLPVTVGVAQASDPNCAADPTVQTIDTKVTPDGRTRIRLKYHPGTQCAYGEISGVPNTSEVWVDRRFPYEGMLGGVYVADSNGYSGTGIWNDNGKEMRACGTSGKGTPITCTIWY